MAKRGNREGSIFKRSNGAWGAAIQVDGRRTYLYARTRKEVQEKLQALQRDIQAGIFPTGRAASQDAPKTVGDFLHYWLQQVAKPTVRPTTWEHYDLCVRRMLPSIGTVKLSALAPHDIRAMYARLQEQGQLASRTVRHCHAVLHNALREATMLHYLGHNPVDEVSPPRAPRHEMQTLTREQVQTLLSSSNGTRWQALWSLLVSTGLRLGEATALRWNDLDLRHGTVVIQRSVQRQREVGLVYVEPKTRSSRRTVLLPPGVVQALHGHKTLVLQQRLMAGSGWHEQDLVFPSLSGGPIDPARVNQALHTALHKAGLPLLRVHDLRHTAATPLLEAGTHPKVVQDLLGHSTVAMTLDLYSHVTPRIQQEATMRMQELLFGGTSGTRTTQEHEKLGKSVTCSS